MMGAYSGPHAKWNTMSCIIYTWDFINSPADYKLIEQNLEKFLAAPVENFPNPASYVRFT